MPSAEERIRSGGATLAFDTNAIIGVSRADRRVTFSAFWTVCDDANRLRDEIPEPLPISIVVPALAHMEVLHDLRTSLSKTPFDRTRVEREMESKRVRIANFHDDTAMRTSEILHGWFPTSEVWRTAKRQRCLEILGLADAPGHAGVASLDWAIAAQAEAEGWVLVTDDSGAEFSRVSCKIKRSALRRVLDEILRERGLVSRIDEPGT